MVRAVNQMEAGPLVAREPAEQWAGLILTHLIAESFDELDEIFGGGRVAAGIAWQEALGNLHTFPHAAAHDPAENHPTEQHANQPGHLLGKAVEGPAKEDRQVIANLAQGPITRPVVALILQALDIGDDFVHIVELERSASDGLSHFVWFPLLVAVQFGISYRNPKREF
jgi:hypothetical protein